MILKTFFKDKVSTDSVIRRWTKIFEHLSVILKSYTLAKKKKEKQQAW